jgi:hypothetical protein
MAIPSAHLFSLNNAASKTSTFLVRWNTSTEQIEAHLTWPNHIDDIAIRHVNERYEIRRRNA